MDAILLLIEAVGMIFVLIWVARGDGARGVFAWKPQAEQAQTPPQGRAGRQAARRGAPRR